MNETNKGAVSELQARAMSRDVNQASTAIEQERAIAEAQGQLTLAKRFPRDMASAHAELMAACKSQSFAAVAFYSVPNRGSGPSIRFAEEVARVYGNFQYGHRELSRGDGKSEVEVYAWDMQNNNRSTRQLTVVHVIDTKAGPKPCRDQSEIDNLIANKASKQIRGRILALVPKWLVADAIEECKKTLAGNNDEPISARIRKMATAFAKYGVTAKHIEAYLGHPLDDSLSDELADLVGVYNAIREGARPSEYFTAETQQDDQLSGSLAMASGQQDQLAAPRQRKPRQQTAQQSDQEPQHQPEQQQQQQQPLQPEPEPSHMQEYSADDDFGDME